MALRIFLLGRFRAEVDGRPVPDDRWPRRGAKHLVKLLCLKPGHQLHREQLMESLWPDANPDAASNSLNKVVYMARRALEPGLDSGTRSRFVHRESDHIVLRAPGGLWVDVDVFEEQAGRALKLGDKETCEAALFHYQGNLLDEDRYEEWLDARRTRLVSLHHDLTLKLADVYESEGRTQQCMSLLDSIVENDAVNEDIHRRLMHLHATSGNRQRALSQFDQCARALANELDTTPDADTLALREALISGRWKPPEPPSATPTAASSRSVDSLAVLRFDAEADDPDLEYLGESLSEGLITRVAQLPGLRVMARSTVARYDPRSVEPQATGRELGVRALVMGRLQRRNKSICVAVELINVDDGALVWGAQYNRVQHDLLQIQEDIIASIAENLELPLSTGDRQRLDQAHTRDPRAHELYLKGRHNWNKRTAIGLERGIEYFQRAIEVDPMFSLAYSGLADCYNLLSLYGVAAPREAMPRARAAAARAIELDENMAEGHTSMAYCKLYYDWDWLGAERLFQRALFLNPNYATAHHWYHECLTAMGRFDEQLAQAERAKELDPLSPIIATEIGWGLYFARCYDEAAHHLTRVLALETRFAVAHYILGLVRQQTGELETAAEAFQVAIESYVGGPFTLAVAALGHARALAGDHECAREQLDELDRLATRHYVSPYCAAVVYAGLGDDNDALRALELALEQRDDRLIYLGVDPLFDYLRANTRFKTILTQLALS
jgi:DNA-binding SARP family transcriptional activator